MLTELSDKNADIVSIAELAVGDPALLSEIIGGLKLKVNTKSKEETVRYNCFKTLMEISVSRPDLLYPAWGTFVDMLGRDNSYDKMAAVHLIAGLVKGDLHHRFDEILDGYFGLLDDKSMIVAIYVASNAGKIVSSRPNLEPRVTQKLLGIEETHHTPSRKALIAAGAIESFGEYWDTLSAKEQVIRFVERQMQSDSPKTRKLAANFLRKFQSMSE
jgi:hypothetical protein